MATSKDFQDMRSQMKSLHDTFNIAERIRVRWIRTLPDTEELTNVNSCTFARENTSRVGSQKCIY